MYYLVERYKGAFDRFRKQSGSLYDLSSKSFLPNQTPWGDEVVSESKIPVCKERKIDNVLDSLSNMEKKGMIKLYHFPDRPSFVPKDDSDLVTKAVHWMKNESEEEAKKTRRIFLKLHPHLEKKLDETLSPPD